jgi:hypothetical protein
MKKIELQNISLQPLRIPAGWNVVSNNFFDVEPGDNIYINGLPDGDIWELFLQDMLLLRDERNQLLLDLGWQPEADPNGNYSLILIKNEDWSNPIASHESQSKSEIVDKINSWLSITSFNELGKIDIDYH